MGVYLEVPVESGKADWLIEHAGAELFAGASFDDVPEGKFLVIVAAPPAGSTGIDVAAVIYDEIEWGLKTRRESLQGRRLVMLVLDHGRALELDPRGRLTDALSPPRRPTEPAPRGTFGILSRLRRR